MKDKGREGRNIEMTRKKRRRRWRLKGKLRKEEHKAARKKLRWCP